ncbi:hypothetical protein BDW22DRAFT_1268608 [Trametopsis cervina]|nr:hypothetical protein BDW22DRAFT_1268608 [Trametopsis cervina]
MSSYYTPRRSAHKLYYADKIKGIETPRPQHHDMVIGDAWRHVSLDVKDHYHNLAVQEQEKYKDIDPSHRERAEERKDSVKDAGHRYLLLVDVIWTNYHGSEEVRTSTDVVAQLGLRG